MTVLHATCVAIGGRGVLLFGPSGWGKSDLGLRLIDRGAMLVSDDGVLVRREGARRIAYAPPAIIGKMEVRGIGIVSFPFAVEAPIALCIALDQRPARMPPDELPSRIIDEAEIPEIAIEPFEYSAPLKVEQALRRWGLQ